MSEGTDPEHDGNFAPCKNVRVRGEPPKKSSCTHYLFLFQVLHNVVQLKTASNRISSNVIRDAWENFRLYIAHEHRACRQKKRVPEILRSVRNGDDGNMGMLVMEYKMEYDPLRY